MDQGREAEGKEEGEGGKEEGKEGGKKEGRREGGMKENIGRKCSNDSHVKFSQGFMQYYFTRKLTSEP